MDRWRVGSRTARRRTRRVLGLMAITVAVGAPVVGAAVTKYPALARVIGVELVGHGAGAGVGMGQWGAFGDAVRYHESYEQILAQFYGGSSSANLATLGGVANPTIKVVLLENLDLTTNVGYDPVVTSPSPFTVTAGAGVSTPAPAPTTALPTSGSSSTATTVSPPTTAPPTTLAASSPTTIPSTAPVGGVSSPGANFVVPGGSAIDFRLQADGTWSAYQAPSCAAAQALSPSVALATKLLNPVVSPASAGANAPSTQLLTVCRHDGVDETVRGNVEAFDRTGYARTLNLVPLQSYLDGVVPAEVSPAWGGDGGSVGAPQGAPWGFQALEAQAVASRSYALASITGGGWNGYADVCDTVACQAYVGENYEAPATTAAVTDTVGEVRVAPTASGSGMSGVLATRFSASTGGWTAPGLFPAVRDRGDACISAAVAAQCNPDHSWKVRVPVGVITRHYRAIGRLLRLHVTARNTFGALGGRALTVRITGSKATVVVSGTDFAVATGLHSDWFAIAHLDRAGTPPTS